MQKQENIKKNFQDLINHCLSMAEKLLLDQKEFYPFGAYLNNSGELTPGALYGGDEFPFSTNVITGLKVYFEKQLANQEIKAYAITFDTKVKNQNFPESIEAITIRIAHRDTGSIPNYYFPYKLKECQIEFFESWGEYSD
ncbi:MAG: hypothetical protein ABI688_07215 [Bacteroidota bacterium]